MRMNDTGYLGNDKLKRTRVPISWTPELLEEFLKCQEDPIYFAEKYIKIVHVDRGLIPIVLYDYQKEIIVAFNDNRRTAVVTSRQAGKCVTGDTKITVRHKDTGQIVSTTFFELYKEVKQNVVGCSDKTSFGSRKFVESYDITGWEILTEAGFINVSQFHKTIEYERYAVLLDNGLQLNCADDHILIESDGSQVFAKDSIGSIVKTTKGDSLVMEVTRTYLFEYMFDLTVDSNSHTYYTNDILSHNTTTASALILHYILFNEHKTVALLANKGDAAREILDRIKLAYEALPKWMQSGIVTWNKGSIELENGCKVIAAATSSSAIRGKSVSLLYIDEAAFVANWDEFFASVFPTISSGTTTKILLTSTPNGLNHFYQICEGAKEGVNGYAYVEVSWQRIPGRDEKWRHETLATMNFDTEKFAQEYEISFIGSAGTLISGAVLKTLKAQHPIQSDLGLRMFEEPVKDRQYVITVDVSRGKLLDYSAFNVIDITEMPYKQVCTYRSNTVTPLDYCGVIFRTAKGYNEASVLVEINDIGGQVADSLAFDYEYENVIYTENAGGKGKRISGGFGNNVDRGIRTTKTVKTIGCSMLKLLVEQKQLIINDEQTIEELSRFSKKGASYEAEQGATDDLVMGLVLFGWLSDQQYFKELTNIETLQRLRDKTDDELDESVTPFGFLDDGDHVGNSGVIDLVQTPGHPEFRNF